MPEPGRVIRRGCGDAVRIERSFLMAQFTVRVELSRCSMERVRQGPPLQWLSQAGHDEHYQDRRDRAAAVRVFIQTGNVKLNLQSAL
jgi:hypothetical protein